ncbi:MAG: VTT domain-containing protein [Candidatus Sungbacteria bacterium]|nr:VTT domain-containing protein [Candidatus Sungbacteria bacterium]
MGFDLISLIRAAGYLGLFGIIFAESGLFLGLFLPGDSLLFTAGLLASQGYFNIALLIAWCFVGAVLGVSFGYFFGQKIGPRIFAKEDSLLFHKSHLERAKNFYEKYGGITIVLARFIPVVRTFVPILAGVGRMRYSSFLFYNIVGGALWVAGLILLGYYLGTFIPSIDRYLLPIVSGIIILSVLPPLIGVLRARSKNSYE